MVLPQDQRERLVQELFDRIARRYDLLNRVISFHLDTFWRKKLLGVLALKSNERFFLDLGTGTGDLALMAAREISENALMVGLDFSPEMLRLARAKRDRSPHGHSIVYLQGSALVPPFKDETFDAIMSAFVLRNITNLNLFFHQAYRLLKPGGRVVTLDMFPPKGFPFSVLYSLYFYRMVPWIGAGLAYDRKAYQYLSDSVRRFDPPETIAGLIRQAGLDRVKVRKFLRGAICLHVGEKPLLQAKQA
ncbi:MAG: ubiquinone/menaquinone biosynthesis methyltransferase [Candidatus Binatia bacterium]